MELIENWTGKGRGGGGRAETKARAYRANLINRQFRSGSIRERGGGGAIFDTIPSSLDFFLSSERNGPHKAEMLGMLKVDLLTFDLFPYRSGRVHLPRGKIAPVIDLFLHSPTTIPHRHFRRHISREEIQRWLAVNKPRWVLSRDKKVTRRVLSSLDQLR